MKRKGLLLYRIDVVSILVVAGTVGLQLTCYAMGWRGWHALAIVPILLGVRQLHLVEHNLSHLPIWRWRPLNEVLGWLCYLSNGLPLEFYEESHVHNHHRYTQRFDSGQQDWSSTFGFAGTRCPDRPVARWYYALTFSSLTWMHCWIEVLRRPRSALSARALASSIVVLGVTACLLWRDPGAWALFFGLPWAVVYVAMGALNYDHHHGCALTGPYDSANVDLRFPCRGFGFNIGYHTAHHLKPTMHWSLLPRFHAKIADRIPADSYVGTVAHAARGRGDAP